MTGRDQRLPREPEHDTQPAAASKRWQPVAVRDVVPTLQCRRWSCMSAGTATSGAGSARSRCCGPGKTAGSGLPPPGTWTRVSVLPRAICETWCATGVCCDGSGLGVGASPVGVAAIGATSTCGTADGFACAAAHCRLPRSWDRLCRVCHGHGTTWLPVMGPPGVSCRAVLAGAAAQRASVLIAGPLGLCYLPTFLCLGIVPVVAGLAGDVLGPGRM